MAVLDEKLSFAVEVRADPIRSSASARAHALSLGSAQADARRTPLASASSDLKILSISGILKSCACAPRPVLFSATLYRPCALTWSGYAVPRDALGDDAPTRLLAPTSS